MKIQSLKLLAIALMLALVPLSVSTVYAGSNGNNVAGRLHAEIIARKADEANLQTNINSEASARKAADTALKNQIDDIVAPPKLSIGDEYGGGIGFWVDEDGQHGLIVAPPDLGGIQWNNGSDTATNAVRDGVNAGHYNTERIIINQGSGSYAAQLCANYQGGGYGDWYLPSKAELNLMYLNIGQGAPPPFTNVGGFSNVNYWSSTEIGSVTAWAQSFFNGYQYSTNKNNTFSVLAVRGF
jgi:hypothetical protein